MQFCELKQLIESTSDAAFAVDGAGRIAAWNPAAEAMFGLSARDAMGSACADILQGTDECGIVCTADCSIQRAVQRHHQVNNFDLQVRTPQGIRWCNVSILIAGVATATQPYSIHIIRDINTRKRLELMLRDFIVTEAKLPADEVKAIVSTTRSATREVELTNREIEVLRLLAKGATSAAIAAQLHISRTTVNNHIQHILQKLNAHNRLEAIRRAERAGLI